MTLNEDYFDAQIRKQIDIRSFTENEVKELQQLLLTSTKQLERFLNRSSVTKFQKSRYRKLIAEIKLKRAALLNNLTKRQIKNLEMMAKADVQHEATVLTKLSPVQVAFAIPSVSVLESLIRNRPMQGAKLSKWFSDLSADEAKRIEREITLGITQGETKPQIVRRIVGTRANKYKDGAVNITRRHASTIVRTSINHVSDTARGRFYKDNKDVISALRWTSTLDGRTSPVCIRNDGLYASVDGSPLPEGYPSLPSMGTRPPAHPNCRSIMIAEVDGLGLIGKRPFVVETVGEKSKRVSIKSESQRLGIKQRTYRKRYAEKTVGRVPAKTDYDTFLRRQSVEFQNDVLGIKRAKLFRAHPERNIREFVNGERFITIDDLTKRLSG